MDFYVSRAMQIAAMEIDDIMKLHEREKVKGYCFQNWNIQDLFKSAPLRDVFMIPEEGCEQHAARIRQELLKEKIALWITSEKQNAFKKIITEKDPPWVCLNVGAVELVHQFDARVYDAVRDGRVKFSYSGSAPKRFGGRLRDRVA